MQTAVASNQPAQRICVLQDDPVLRLQAALRAVEAVLQKRQQWVWRCLLLFSRLEARREALLMQLCAFGSGG